MLANGHALNHAYGRKLNGAEEECRRQGIAFLPIVAETFGGWHPEAGRQVKKLGAALARGTPHWAGGGRSCLPSVDQNGHPAAARQCCHSREQDSTSPGAYINGIL